MTEAIPQTTGWQWHDWLCLAGWGFAAFGLIGPLLVPKAEWLFPVGMIGLAASAYIERWRSANAR